MIKNYYLPPDEAGRVTWLANFFNKLNITYATLFGVSAADMTLLGDMNAYYAALISQLATMRTTLQDATKFKNHFCNDPVLSPISAFPPISVTLPSVPSTGGLWAFVSQLARQIKAHAFYTDSIGEDLGIVGADRTFDELTAKTTLTSVFSANQVIVGFTKPVEVEGVRIYSRRSFESDFTKLADDLHPPYNDTRPNLNVGQPEKREYKAWYLKHDHIIGLESDVVSVVVNIP